jgi:cellulose synthase/poly-beta-1,6-N-acetylglucosamine synthase-like glycosyltransferase
MAFLASVLDQHGWTWFTLAEDVELHLALIEAGLRVDFARETMVLAEMPVTFEQAESQNERWERGRLEMLRQRGVALLLDGLKRCDRVRIDAVVEQMIPPLSVPVLAAGAVLVGGLLTRSRLATLLAAFGLGGQICYVLTALALVGAPWRIYAALAYAPTYVGWKVWLYARSLAARGDGPWVRTARLTGLTSPPNPLSGAEKGSNGLH